MPERLLDDHARVLRQTGLGQALHDSAEQERRDLEVEDRVLGPVDRLGDALVRRRVAEVAGHVGEPVGEALEHLLVQLLAGADDRLARSLLELVDRPVVDGDAQDRAVEQAALLEPVERTERHHLGEVAGDPERDEDVRRLRLGTRCRARRARGSWACRRHAFPPTPSCGRSDARFPFTSTRPRPKASTRPQRPGMSSSSRCPMPAGSAGSTTRWSPTGSRPSIVRSSSSGAPVDHA